MTQKIKLPDKEKITWEYPSTLQELFTCHATSNNDFGYDTINIGYSLPKTKSRLKVGNLVIYNTHYFNWLERMMWKLLLGFDIENVEE